MSKNKKKSPPRKAKESKTASAAAGLKAVSGACRQAASKADAAVRRLLRPRWSVLPLALLLFGCITLLSVCAGSRVLFGELPDHIYSHVQFYLLDYRAGFVPQALVGSVLSLFVKHWSISVIGMIVRCAVTLSLALQALLAAIVLRRAGLRGDPFGAAMALVFVCCPFAILENCIFFGALDVFSLILTLMYFINPRARAAELLTLPLCLAGVLIHPAFLMQLFPAVIGVRLFYIVQDTPVNKRRAAALCLTALITVAVGFYLTFYARYTAAMTPEELYEYVCGKFPYMKTTPRYAYSLDHYIYGQMNGKDVSSAGAFISNLTQIAASYFTAEILVPYLVLLLPLLGMFEALWIFCLRHTEKGKRLPYYMFALLPLLIVPGSLLLSDTMRTVSGAVITQFLLFFAVYRHSAGEAPAEKLRGSLTGWRRPAVFGTFAVYLVLSFCLASVFYR